MNRRFQSPFVTFFVLPAIAIYGLFVLWPFANTFLLSFQRWDGSSEAKWVGATNYYERGEDGELGGLARDEVFRRALINNSIYWVITLMSEVAAGLALAALLVRVRHGRGFYRLALSTPLMIALVASAVLWRQLLAERGVVNNALDAVGLESLAKNWMSPQYVVYTVSLISGWAYAGFYMLIFYAGLERIPAELREAALIDGASQWSIFRKVELPLLRPVIAVAVLLCSTGAFRAFDLFYVIVGTAISSKSEVASTWLVKNAFTFKRFGYASAIAVVVVILVMSLATLLSRWVAKEREMEEF